MDHARMFKTGRSIAAAALLALATSHAPAAEPAVVWVDNESFGFANCGRADALPGGQDPKELMAALRERGLLDASQMVRARGLGQGTVTLTPVSGSVRCEGATSSMVFRMASYDPASGRSWSANLVSRLPASAAMPAAVRSAR